jgi:hypothetical protein
MTTDQWIQLGILAAMGIGVLLTMAGIVSKSSRATGELSATVKLFQGAVVEFKQEVKTSIETLYNSRFDHERRITEIETGITHCEPCNSYRHKRAGDEEDTQTPRRNANETERTTP